MPYKITGIDVVIPQAMLVDAQSQFADCVLQIFRQGRPTKLIETGTFMGTGTTAIVAACLRECGINDAEFFSIEVNPQHHLMAVQNLRRAGLSAKLLLGLSVPRSILPSRDDIRRDVVEKEVDGIFVDHLPQQRVDAYFYETDFPGVEDDLLGKCLKQFDYKPDFLLLDSAGHMGNIEFNYVVPLIRSRCCFALDDTNHVKHYHSVEQMRKDPRFRILAESKEKFGFCFAEFTPT